MKLTLSLEEVCHIFRSYGVPMEKGRLADGIEAGAYPFGRVVKSGSRRTFEIWAKDVQEFIDSKIPKEEQ